MRSETTSDADVMAAIEAKVSKAEGASEPKAEVKEETSKEKAAPTQEQPALDLTDIPDKFHVKSADGSIDVVASAKKMAKSYTELESYASSTRNEHLALLRTLAETPTQPQTVATQEQADLEDQYLSKMEALKGDASLTDRQKAARQMKLWAEYTEKVAEVKNASKAAPGITPQDMARVALERAEIASQFDYYRTYRQQVDSVLDYLEVNGNFGPGATQRDRIIQAALVHRDILTNASGKAGKTAEAIEDQVRSGAKAKAEVATSGAKAPQPKHNDEASQIKAGIMALKDRFY